MLLLWFVDFLQLLFFLVLRLVLSVILEVRQSELHFKLAQ